MPTKEVTLTCPKCFEVSTTPDKLKQKEIEVEIKGEKTKMRVRICPKCNTPMEAEHDGPGIFMNKWAVEQDVKNRRKS